MKKDKWAHVAVRYKTSDLSLPPSLSLVPATFSMTTLYDNDSDLLLDMYQSTVLFPIRSTKQAPPVRTYTVAVSSGVFISDAISYLISQYPMEQPCMMNSMSVKYINPNSSRMILTFESTYSTDALADIMAKSNDLRLMHIFRATNIVEVFPKSPQRTAGAGAGGG